MSETPEIPDRSDALPIFPARASAVFDDPGTAVRLLSPVLDSLASVVAVGEADLARPTPCDQFTVAELRRHVLAWLQFFAAALDDPDGRAERLDPDTWTLNGDDDPTEIVAASSHRLVVAIEGGVGDRLVVMSQARMQGSAVVAMALGEYIVHGWDLAVATDRAWTVADEAADEARRFLEGVVASEHRGPDSGFFDVEINVDSDASPLDRLLAYAGRDPGWKP